MERKSGTGRSAEAQAFARLMGELKERSGRSYGALARLLHTSTSTLHRYCSGEALPAEFVAVDRFARACGATAAEAVELHRAWLLADARRRAVVEEAVVVTAADAVVVDAGVVERAAPEVAAESGVPRAPGPRRRGRRLLPAGAVAAAAVVALAVGIGALPDPGPERGAPQAGPTAATAAATGTATGPGTGPTADPRTGPATTPPAPGQETSAGTTTGPAPAPGPGTATSGASPAPAPASPPMRADVRSHVWAAGCGHAYLAESGPSAVPAPPVEADAPAWAAARGAVHAGTQIVEVTLHGTGPDPVVLEGLQVRVAGRRTPPRWNVYQMSQGCGGALTPAVFAVNLDAPRPLARPVAGNDAGETIKAPAFPFRVSAAEPAVLRVEATTTGCDCDWYLDLRWSGPTGSGTLRLDDGAGRAWRVSAAPSDRPVYGYAHEQGRWTR
ncbi:helix-turn-helix domain-containing protein [Streptomyces sp. NBC_00435]|uniref:helix-turn-helix domain-containing protein n=1 Tax=Streptomyces sp. NBC_00435 TaxID=2903649 RepID=UPI002E1DA945